MNAFRSAYPTLCQLLDATPFDGDAKAAVELDNPATDMKAALQERKFALNELMWLLCGAVVPEWANFEASQLESDLAAIVSTVGIAIARAAYKDKFLVESKSKIKDAEAKRQDAKNKLEDLRYELAVTAKACSVLDAGTIQLEKPIPDPNKEEKNWKNSDVFGTFHKQPVRIEVTVLHESLPPAIHIELDDLVRQAEIASGFRITLRSVLVDEGYAGRVRALLELLHHNHVASGGETVEIDGVRFEWKKGAYHCSQENSPFESICFYAANEFVDAEKMRDIIHPCSVRNVTPKYVLEDNPNPPGVITSADLPDAPTQVPVSTKIHQMLDGKRQQCEEGVLNIVAFGNPLPMHDREVTSAVHGPAFVAVQFWTDKLGVRHSGKGVLKRDAKAPFVSAQYVANDDAYAQFVEPFRKMSAVWHIRLGSYATSKVIPNPNASVLILRDLIEAFSDPSPPSADSQAGGGTTSLTPPDRSDQEIDIVWAEVAENYVQGCDSIAEARSVLEQLKQAGHSLDELRTKVEQLWSEPSKEEKATKFFSPTKDELAMTFVVDCGGYEQAKACLDAYVEESGVSDAGPESQPSP